MNQEQELILNFIDVLGKQNPTMEEKLMVALVKQVLLTNDLITFVNDVQNAFKGLGKVSAETVKGAIEYCKANNEVKIRNANYSDEQKEEMVKRETDRLTIYEVWLLGSLAYWGLLKVCN